MVVVQPDAHFLMVAHTLRELNVASSYLTIRFGINITHVLSLFSD